MEQQPGGPIIIDLDGVTTEFAPLDPGYVEAEVDSCTPGVGKTSGKPKLDWRFTITSEEQAGRKAFYTTSLQKQALFSFKRVMLALGFPEESLGGKLAFDPTTVVGLPCTLVIVPDVWDGKTRGKVDRVLPAGSSEELAVQAVLPAEEEIPF